MTTDKNMGSKLANSVRQAKEQQTQETTPVPREKEVVTSAKKEVERTYFIPSKRVWPD